MTSFLLFYYTGSAMKNHVYSFRPRLVVLQEPDFLSEKTKSFRNSDSPGLLYFFEILHTCSPCQCLQSFSLVCFVPLNKNEQSSFSKHVDPKLFLTFLLIYTDLEKIKRFSQTLSKALIRGTSKFQGRLITPA